MMRIEERVPLAPCTTLGVGGSARFFADCTSEAEVGDALHDARTHKIPVAILGGGSNTLIPDVGFDGLVIKVSIPGMTFADEGEGSMATVGAGVSWDAFVREASERTLWGIENLAGIPGTVGGAVVQNIGAYGSELAETFVACDTVLLANGASKTIDRSLAALAYRTSLFKHRRDLVITRATFRLAKRGTPNLAYPGLKEAQERGDPLATPGEIAEAVRRIRSEKFPHGEGTAGSFFKNPILPLAQVEALKKRFPELPTSALGEGRAKIALAWILDHVLNLRGYARGPVRMFERQPLALVTSPRARAEDVEALAHDIAKRVRETIGIDIEREVETLRAK